MVKTPAAKGTTRKTKHRPWERPHGLFLAVALFLLIFFYIPVAHVFVKAFVKDGRFAPEIFFSTLSSPYTLRIVGFTFFQALLSTLFSLLIGLPGAYILTKYRFPGRSFDRSVSAVPFVLPPILVVLGFVIFFGNNGFLNRVLGSLFDLSSPPLRILYSLKAIILAHGFYNFPIALRVVGSLWQSLSPTQEWAASTLGARGTRLFRTITLPQLLPAIYAASALIFMFCFTSFAVILVLGGGPELTTVEVEIYRLARISFDLHTAAALSIIALILTLSVMYLYVRLQSSSSYHQALSGGRGGARRILEKPGKMARLLMGLYAALSILVIAGPLMAIIVYSFQEPVSWSGERVFTLKWYAQILGLAEGSSGRFSNIAVEAVSNSLAIAVLTTAVAVPMGTALSYFTVRYSTRFRRLIDTLTMAPMTTSSVVLGLGYLLISRFFSPPSHLTPLFIVAAHGVISYPFVVRTVSSVLRKISPSQRYAAMLLGAPPGRVFRSIELPLITPALLAGAAFTFGISLGEMNATIILSSSTTTIPIAIYRLIGSYNFYGACALGTILVLVSLGSFLILDSYSDRDIDIWN